MLLYFCISSTAVAYENVTTSCDIFVYHALFIVRKFGYDLGATEEGILVFGVDAAAFGGEGFAAYTSGNYTLEVTDATSGTIKFVDPMDPSGSEVVVTYTKLTDNTVLLSNAAPFALENCQLTLVEENVYIQPMM